MLEYVRDPAEIYRRSFATIRAEADLARLAKEAEPLAVRVIHACGMTDVAADLEISPGAVAAGRKALADGATIFVDAEMVAHGIVRKRLAANNDVVCTLHDPRVPDLARKLGTTRSAAAVELWRGRLEGAVVAIGNAPTALFHLLETIDAGGPMPALVLGFPVGFVGAAESKAELVSRNGIPPFVALKGRRGGSAMAAAAVNALAGDEP